MSSFIRRLRQRQIDAFSQGSFSIRVRVALFSLQNLLKARHTGLRHSFLRLAAAADRLKILCVMQNFIAIAIFIADGLYNFLKISILSIQVSPLNLRI